MEAIRTALLACPLFAGFSREELIELTAPTRFSEREYEKDEIIAFEEDDCTTLGVIVRGSIFFQRVYPSGKVLTIDTLRTGSGFGEALIFADDGRYPATLTAAEATRVIYIARDEVARYCRDSEKFEGNLLRMLSNRVLMLNKKLKALSYQSVRQKVTNYILEEEKRQGGPLVTLEISRADLADSLGIPRPSLSRELIALKAEGWIDFDRKSIRVIEREALRKCFG